ncbi:MAG TPA: hypothetical protein VGO58_07665 [Chitinophagaceae bacterium]|jgi:hypothetical protein|nr:hypothetical protein [Chitinophagaceae bacterium]
MEVHHHAHTSRKKWTHYFWEFIMLFLAVFCGFLAEYQLEHKIEKERGKQYLRSFYEDLKADTARIAFNVGFDDEKLTDFDNLNGCFDTVSKNIHATDCLLTLIKYSSINRPFKITERTLGQLANAGGFRLLKKEDADSIIAYQKMVNDLEDFQTIVYQYAQDNVRSTFNLVVSFPANAQMFKPEENKIISTFNETDVTAPVLLSDDNALLNRYFNDLLLYYRITYNHKRMLLLLKNYQLRLIEFFKNKYHLK